MKVKIKNINLMELESGNEIEIKMRTKWIKNQI